MREKPFSSEKFMKIIKEYSLLFLLMIFVFITSGVPSYSQSSLDLPDNIENILPQQIQEDGRTQNINLIESNFPLKQFNVTGTITDAITREPMPGVTVLVKGTFIGAITDTNGKYTISVPDNNSVIVFSFIGYETQEISLNGQMVLNVVLTQRVQALQDIVVIGYGTVRKKDLTGSVSSVGAEQIKEIPVTRIEQALGGKIAGVMVRSVSGEPGVSQQIRIRGVGSISAGIDPLYVVDGMPVESLQMLNPTDIESIDILKDASATAIYGSRGSNGVIIINTKRGKVGKSNITLGTYFGFQRVEKVPKMMNALEQAHFTFDGFRNSNIDAGNNISGSPTTWKRPVPQLVMDVIEGRVTYDEEALDAIFRTAPQYSFQLGATGGNEAVQYAISTEYLNQDGVLLNSNFKRYNLRANIDARLSKKLSVKLNLSPSYSIKDGEGYSGGNQGGIIGAAVFLHSFFPLLNETGEYNYLGGSTAMANIPNPLARLNENIANTKNAQFSGNINLEYSIFDDLKYNLLLGTNLNNNSFMSFVPSLHSTFDNPASGSSSNFTNTYWLVENTFHYQKSVGLHNFAGLAGFTTQKDLLSSSYLYSNKFPNNLVPTLSAASTITSGTSNISEWSMVSYLARLNYNYDNKYYLTTSIRTDGSSRFGTENKYGVFPSLALAWRISDEEFLKNVSFISDIKLRASYGESGNNDIGNYEHYATVNFENYPFNGSPVGGFAQGQIDNPYLTWEKQKQLNIGTDISILNERLNLTIDRFSSRNYDLLLNVNIPLITGFSSSLQNIGEVKNLGWEFVVSSKNLVGKFEWSSALNLSTYRNEVVKLGPEGDPIYSGVNITMIGQPIGMFYGLIYDGVFMNQEELAAGPIYNPNGSDRSHVGDRRFVDVSGPNGTPDGVINSYDNTIMGNPHPDFTYGFTNSFSFKNISLVVNLQGVHGNQIYNRMRWSGDSGRGRVRTFEYNNSYWKSEEDPGDGLAQRPNDVPTGGARLNGSQFLEDGSFLRINNITLSYSLPEQLCKNIALSSLRFYVSAINPFLFTKYTGFNPDANTYSDPLQPGYDDADYPLAKSITLGLNAAF